MALNYNYNQFLWLMTYDTTYCRTGFNSIIYDRWLAVAIAHT